MFEYLPQALSSLGVALNIGKSLVEVRDTAQLQEALMQFNSAIIDAQSKIISSQAEQSSLAAKIDELEKECMSLKSWEAEREKYSRKEIAPGIFVYIETGFVGEFKSAHKYCCNCFDNHIKSTLQQFNVEVGRQVGLSCHKKCPDLVFRHYQQNT